VKHTAAAQEILYSSEMAVSKKADEESNKLIVLLLLHHTHTCVVHAIEEFREQELSEGSVSEHFVAVFRRFFIRPFLCVFRLRHHRHHCDDDDGDDDSFFELQVIFFTAPAKKDESHILQSSNLKFKMTLHKLSRKRLPVGREIALRDQQEEKEGGGQGYSKERAC
jgi:hypothetical protein